MLESKEISKLSEEELLKNLTELKTDLNKLGLQLRAKESSDVSKYRKQKKLIAQIKTELSSRKLTK